MRRRIFIAINLPPEVKKGLAEYSQKWPELPARWTKPDNIHITLIFLGYLPEEELPSVCEITERIAKEHDSFLIDLNQISYGPPKKMPPRMIWVSGQSSPELAKLKENLEDALSEDVHFHHENRAFSPHITLARIKGWEWSKIDPEQRPEIEQNINFKFEVESIEIMESELKRGGAVYTILESIPLKS